MQFLNAQFCDGAHNVGKVESCVWQTFLSDALETIAACQLSKETYTN